MNTIGKATQIGKPEMHRRPHHGGKVHHVHGQPTHGSGWSARANYERCAVCQNRQRRGPSYYADTLRNALLTAKRDFA